MSDTTVTVIGFLAGLLTTIAFIPQVLKIWKTRSARDISLGMYVIFTCGVVLWLAYGLLLASLPIVLANTLTLTLAMAVLVMKVRFG
jgi:MtN3 and saliva related transmembrane protein